MDAAQAFAEHLKSEKQPFSPRPYNRFEPRDSVWWVVPETDWPAYHLGKYIFRDAEDRIKCGLNVEKGFGEIAARGYNYDTSLDDDWQWFKSIDDIENGIVEGKLNKVENYINKLFFELGAGMATDPSDYDPNQPKSDRYVYEYKNGNLILNEDKSDKNQFIEFEDLREIEELPSILESLGDKVDWCWIDIDILVAFKKKQFGEEENEIIDMYKLENIFSPFERWLGR